MNASQSINLADLSVNNINTLDIEISLEDDNHSLEERVELATYNCREEAFGMAGGCSAGLGLVVTVIGGGLWLGGQVNSTVLVAGQTITGVGIILLVSGIALGSLECYYKQESCYRY